MGIILIVHPKYIRPINIFVLTLFRLKFRSSLDNKGKESNNSIQNKQTEKEELNSLSVLAS